MGTAYSLPVILMISEDISKIAFFKKSYKGIYHFLERSEGKAGLELAKTTALDLILIDSTITDMQAFDLCREIRKMTHYLETPILLMTPHLKKTFIQQALEAGASDFLNEPLDKGEMDQKLAVAFRKLHPERRAFETASKPSVPLTSEKTALFDKAFQEFLKIRKSSKSLAILFLELDGLKKMKATIAEEAQLQLIPVLQHNLRKYDVLIPQAPGKCLIYLPKTSKSATQVIGETIREAVTQIPFETPLSVSIGVITLDQTSPDFTAAQDFVHLIEILIKTVDEAKKIGNTIVFTSLSPP